MICPEEIPDEPQDCEEMQVQTIFLMITSEL